MKLLLLLLLLALHQAAFCWGFYAHRQINYYAVFLLPPEMLAFYKPYQPFLAEHAVDPDKRRYVVATEGARHYIDIDRYGAYPYDSLPREWLNAVAKYSADTLTAYGIVPWWIQIMLRRLTHAFEERNAASILKFSAEIGHYIADAHVPLHACSNHNGQLTDQRGIHGFWESRIPEKLAATNWDFFMDKAHYMNNPLHFTWLRVLESAAAADTVLTTEKKLSRQFSPDGRFAFEERNGQLVKQYSTAYTVAYHDSLNDMVQRRMRQSIYAVASFWYTAWINAGQPDLKQLSPVTFSAQDSAAFRELEQQWKSSAIKGKICD
ncbi:MAG: zinc dependent phospholipase C family protein [Chitinophagaceae bacterium]